MDNAQLSVKEGSDNFSLGYFLLPAGKDILSLSGRERQGYVLDPGSRQRHRFFGKKEHSQGADIFYRQAGVQVVVAQKGNMATARHIDPVAGPALQAENLPWQGRLQGIRGFSQDPHVKMVGKSCLVFEEEPDFPAGTPIAWFIDKQALVVGADQDGGAGLVVFAGEKNRKMPVHETGDGPVDKFA